MGISNSEELKMTELKMTEEQLKEQIKRVPTLSPEALAHRFMHHVPGAKTGENHSFIRKSCLELALLINARVPEGREKSLAITHLEEVMMWANAGIARNS